MRDLETYVDVLRMLLEPLWRLGDARSFAWDGAGTDNISTNEAPMAWYTIEDKGRLGDSIELVLER